MNADEITNLLDQAYLDLEDDRHPWPITPSQLGNCQRQLALRLSGVPTEPLSPWTRRVFELGHGRGERLAERLRDSLEQEGWQVSLEEPVYAPLPIDNPEAHEVMVQAVKAFEDHPSSDLPLWIIPSGKAEGRLHVGGSADLVAWKEGALAPGMNELLVIDFKTAGGYGFGKLETEGPSEGYVAQLLAYTDGLLSDRFEGYAARSFLVYESKDSDARKGHVAGDIRALEVGVDQGDWHAMEQAKERAATAIRAWMNGTADQVPEPYEIGGTSGTAKKLPWNCDYCSIGPLVGGCWGGQVENRSKRENRKSWYLAEELHGSYRDASMEEFNSPSPWGSED